METLLNNEQKEIFMIFSQEESRILEDPKILKEKECDKDYAVFHERTQSNLSRLVTPRAEQFEKIKDFLKLPITTAVERYDYLTEFRYCRIFSMADALAIDWVYFPKSCMRRNMLELFHHILGCELNFVICYTEAQKKLLQE